jgi:hypothetical protein
MLQLALGHAEIVWFGVRTLLQLISILTSDMNAESLDAEHLAQMNFIMGSSRLRGDFDW